MFEVVDPVWLTLSHHERRKAKDVPPEVVERSIQKHLAAMAEERALVDDGTEHDPAQAINADREAAGKKPFDLKTAEQAESAADEPPSRPAKLTVGLTDPDARFTAISWVTRRSERTPKR